MIKPLYTVYKLIFSFNALYFLLRYSSFFLYKKAACAKIRTGVNNNNLVAQYEDGAFISDVLQFALYNGQLKHRTRAYR